MATERRPRKSAATSRSRSVSVTARRTPARKTTTGRKAAPKTAARKTAKVGGKAVGKAAGKVARKVAPKRGKTAKAPDLPMDVKAAVSGALDKKAEQVHVLDLRQGSAFTDFFVIATGNNIRQVQAIADGVEESLKKMGQRPSLVEGYQRGEWILLDYFDFIVHVFTPATREFYGLERLWGDAERLEISS